MDQERQQQESSTEPAVEGLADRLDAHAAERILRRAIELHSTERDDSAYDLGLIEKVAKELDIPGEYVAAAMAEELQISPSSPPRLVERLFVRDRLSVTKVAQQPADRVEERTKTWMSKHEGLRVARTTPAGVQWAKDPSPMVAVRTGLKMQQGTGALRNARRVTTEFRSIGDNTAVTVSADARLARTGAIAGATIGAVGSAAIGALIWEGGILSLSFWIAALIGVLVFFVAAAAITKAWASSVRTGLDRAATGIVEPEALERHESVPDMLMRFRDEWKQMRRNTKP